MSNNRVFLICLSVCLAVAVTLAITFAWRPKSDLSAGGVAFRTTSARDCTLGVIGAPPRRQTYIDWPCIDRVANDWLNGMPNADANGVAAVIIRAVRDGTVKQGIPEPGKEEPQ